MVRNYGYLRIFTVLHLARMARLMFPAITFCQRLQKVAVKLLKYVIYGYLQLLATASCFRVRISTR